MPHALLSSLGVVCPACDQLNAAGQVRCAGCSKPLFEGPSARKAPGAPEGVVPPGMKPVKAAPAPAPGRAVPPPPESSKTPVIPMPPAALRAPAGSTPTKPVPRPGASPSGSPFILAVIAGSSPGERFRLVGGGCAVGRSKGAILFKDDAFVAPEHASFLLRDGALFVRDHGTASGVFVSISKPELLIPGSLFAAGIRLFRYLGHVPMPALDLSRPKPYGAPVPLGSNLFAVEEVLVGNRSGRVALIAGPLFTLGQAKCDLSFPQDPGLAPHHCELSPTAAGAVLRDLSGGLGTFVRLGTDERPLQPGDRVRIGLQTLQVEVGA